MTPGAKWDVIDRCLSVPVNIDRCRQTLMETKPDWLAIVSVANDYFVGPALWTALSQPTLRNVVPDDACAYLEMIHARNAERNAKIHQQCTEIGEILASIGLRAVLLKGAAWLFDDSGAPRADRMMRDIDLLIAADGIKAAIQALISAGYQDSGKAFLEDGHLHFEEHGHFHQAPLIPGHGEAIVEIHQDVAYRTDFLPATELINASKQVAPGLLLPALHHRILHNAIHTQVSNGDRLAGRFDLHDGLDLARLVGACGPEFDWQAFADEARRHNCFQILSGAFHATHRILGSPLLPPFAGDRRGRWHGWRCENQRKWPMLAGVAAMFGKLEVAFNWDRDAYAFNLDSRPTIRDHIRVNLRRGLRLSRFFSRFALRRSDLMADHFWSRSTLPDGRKAENHDSSSVD